MTEKQIYNRKNLISKRINKHFKYIKKKLNLSIDVKTKTCRDAYATCLKRANRPIEQIAEMLGQSSPKVTKHYLDSFEDKQVFEINSCLPT